MSEGRNQRKVYQGSDNQLNIRILIYLIAKGGHIL